MSLCFSKTAVVPLRMLCRKVLSVNQAKTFDAQFLKNVVTKDLQPEYSGFNTKLFREMDMELLPATKVHFPPLINSNPKDVSTTYTAMEQAKQCAKNTGQGFTILTADQDIFKSVVSIMWSRPTEFKHLNFVPRLGGLHWIMSFCGCVGSLMKNTGLKELLSDVFGSVDDAFWQAVSEQLQSSSTADRSPFERRNENCR